MPIATTLWIIAELEPIPQGAGFVARIYPYLHAFLEIKGYEDPDPYRALGLALKGYLGPTKSIPGLYDFDESAQQEYDPNRIDIAIFSTRIQLFISQDGSAKSVIYDSSFKYGAWPVFEDPDPDRALGLALDAYITCFTGQAFARRLTSVVEERVSCPVCHKEVLEFTMLPTRRGFICRECWALEDPWRRGKAAVSPFNQDLVERLIRQRDQLRAELAHLREPHGGCTCGPRRLCLQHDSIAERLFTAYHAVDMAIRHLWETA